MEQTIENRPPKFTGKWAGVHFYEGNIWRGPTNRLGDPKYLERPGRKSEGHNVMNVRSNDGELFPMWSGCFSAVQKGR